MEYLETLNFLICVFLNTQYVTNELSVALRRGDSVPGNDQGADEDDPLLHLPVRLPVEGHGVLRLHDPLHVLPSGEHRRPLLKVYRQLQPAQAICQ